MSDQPKPPREWRIHISEFGNVDNAFRQPFVNNLGEIHVIEKSAYDAKCIELDRKEWTLQNTFNHWQQAMAERDALKAQLADSKQLREADNKRIQRLELALAYAKESIKKLTAGRFSGGGENSFIEWIEKLERGE